ncbi:MAG: ankyrin repeat domain-containing protein [Saccharofermentans sp.]|nr:ankyrin repeat domain-containing protein [Saccharofermentans sp.]
MAFVGIFLMWLLVILVVLGITTFLSIIFFVIAFILKRKKKNARYVFLVLGWVFIAPVILVVSVLIYAFVSVSIENNSSLTYNVMHSHFTRVETMLREGVNPDCSLYGDDEAEDGEYTILACLCDYGFINTAALSGEYGHIESAYTQDHNELMLMAELLIDYGADVNHVYYDSEHDYSWHSDSPYGSSDRCGRTPFLNAVAHNDLELARLLVENGADINAVDACGYNAYHLIADYQGGLERSGTEMLEYLVQIGVEYDGSLTNHGRDLEFLVMRNNELEYYNRFFEIMNQQ